MKNKHPVKALLIEDNPYDGTVIREMLLEDNSDDFEVSQVYSLSQGLEFIKTNKIDVILLDLGLPDSKGLDALHALMPAAKDIPIIVQTGLEDEKIAIEAIRNQAQDYLFKDKMNKSLLCNSIHYAIERKKMAKKLKESECKYKELSIVDNLTQLYNKRYFYEQLQIEADRSSRYEQPLSLILLDVDDFKKYNDTYGHIEGDKVLMRLGQVIKKCLRKTDSAFRYGGEEFIVLQPMTAMTSGTVTAERIRTEFKEEIFMPLPDKKVHMTVSLGCGQYKTNEDIKDFVHRIDQFMYRAKKKGKDTVFYH